MKKSKTKKLDIVIYCSLFMAIVCVGLSAIDYSHSMKKTDTIKGDVKEAIQEITTPTPEANNNEEETDSESEALKQADIPDKIKKHIDEILDYYTKDQAINYSQVKTWGTYEVYDVEYVKEITDYYYTYQFKLKITGSDPKLPVDKNLDLSTEGNTVIILNANIARNNAGYYCKTLEIPQQTA